MVVASESEGVLSPRSFADDEFLKSLKPRPKNNLHYGTKSTTYPVARDFHHCVAIARQTDLASRKAALWAD
jgi:hypothetical protein